MRTKERKTAFLRAFGENASILKSARLVGIDRTTHYDWLAKDAKYKAVFQNMLPGALEALEPDLWRLAMIGVFKPIIYKGKHCYAPRQRTICDLVDGTSAFPAKR
jgi:hypothetical protein